MTKNYTYYDELRLRVQYDFDDACWPWKHTILDSGYGQVSVEGKGRRAHVVAYELRYGPVPDGMILDHYVCQVKCCWNPDHVEPVTHSENAQRHIAIAPETWGGNRNKVCCPYGHEYTEDNTYICGRKSGGYFRICKTCQKNPGLRKSLLRVAKEIQMGG